MKNRPYRFLLYLAAKALGFIFYPVPLRIGVKIGALSGRIAYHILPKEREKTLAHLGIAFGKEKSEEEIEEIAKNVFSNLGRNAFEWLNFPKLDKVWFDTYITAEGLERLREAEKKKRGIIVLASHFGNWEFLAAYLSHLGCHGAVIVRRIYIEQFNRLFLDMRRRIGNEVIYRDESPKRPLKILKEGGFIGILPDQDTDSVEGVFVDFFGRPAYTPSGPVKFAMKTGAAMLPMFLIREGERFRFVVEKEVEMEISGDRERDILVNTIKWMRVLEKYIRRYPDQWVWMHRRWKTRPK